MAPQVQARIEQLSAQRLLYRCGVIELEILRSAVEWVVPRNP
jgi:hypothetical protein